MLRWLAAEPRPVTMGPVGQCVKRGWCRPAFRAVVEDGIHKTVAFYVVTNLGHHVVRNHDGDRPARPAAP